jgi:hypothetical protein
MPLSATELAAMRKEVVGTLAANPAASFDTVLSHWGLRHATTPDATQTNRLADIYAQEGKRLATTPRKPWWKRS